MKELVTANVPQETAVGFMTGGNALFTVKSLVTGTRFTYKILKDNNAYGVFKVSFLYGKDNTKDYREIGNVMKVGEEFFYMSKDSYKKVIQSITFEYIFIRLMLKKVIPNLEIWHEGRCCRCGRVLTVPESIAMGIGPECAFKQ